MASTDSRQTINIAGVNTPRISDWLGPWAMEQTAFQTLVQSLDHMNWSEHMQNFQAAERGTPSGQFNETVVGDKRIAIINLLGPLMKSRASTGGTSTVEARLAVRAAVQDSRIHGILLRVDSPGGTVFGTEALASDVELARRRKPIMAHVEDVCASAAYWVASQVGLGNMYASWPTTLVGSIGTFVIIDRPDPNRVSVFASGPLKAPGADGHMTPEQSRYQQGLIDKLQANFSRGVAAGRYFNPEEMQKIATGAAWLAPDAEALRLIDGVQSIEVTLSMLAQRM